MTATIGPIDGVRFDAAALAALLSDAVDSGASVGFLAPLADGEANALHRAEVQKLFVLRSHRGRGIASALMAAVEDLASSLGRHLLVLDTRLGDHAERLYAHLGYQRAGVIPAFALSSAGTLDGTVLFYKQLPRVTAMVDRAPS